MIVHDDVLGRILTILKQDDYYRTLEELPVINSLTTYDDIQLFPELYDTTTIIERVTGEADLIKRQLRQPIHDFRQRTHPKIHEEYKFPVFPHLKSHEFLRPLNYSQLETRESSKINPERHEFQAKCTH